jgi:hypothetical protein
MRSGLRNALTASNSAAAGEIARTGAEALRPRRADRLVIAARNGAVLLQEVQAEPLVIAQVVPKEDLVTAM